MHKIESDKFDKSEKSVAIIGAGAAGLTAAWQLRKNGYRVTVFEKDDEIGGKLRQAIPSERLSKESLDSEIGRMKSVGINFLLNAKLTKEDFKVITETYDAVIIACGAHSPVVLPIEGKEKLIKGLEFLKAVKKEQDCGKRPDLGEKIVVIGAGNVAMDVVCEAYYCGAKNVTAIDIQKPAAFPKEIDRCKALGAEILYPCFCEKVTDKGLYLKDGQFLEADSVIICVGDRPVFDFVEPDWLDERGMLVLNCFAQTKNDKVFAAGDAVKQGVFSNAVADGRIAVKNIMCLLNGDCLDEAGISPMVPANKLKPEYYQGLSFFKEKEIEPWEKE